MLAKMWSKEKTHPLLVGIQVVQDQTYPKDTSSHCRNTCSTVFSDVLYFTRQKLKTIQMSVNGRTDDENVHLHNGLLFSCLNNKMMKFSGKWMVLEKKSFLCQATQIQKSKYDMYLLICGCQLLSLWETNYNLQNDQGQVLNKGLVRWMDFPKNRKWNKYRFMNGQRKGELDHKDQIWRGSGETEES